jgi:predicted ABC-type ATPase
LSETTRPFCLCLAGPNGSGKSTLTAQIRTINSLENWIDPDVVAREMGDEPAAFVVARNRRVDFAQGLLDFGFETVFSHESNADFLEALKTLGYEVHLYFVCTEDPRINVNRVSNRVRLGGHNVPTDKIFERYTRALGNLVRSVGKFDRIVLFDNSSIDGAGRVAGEIANAPAVRVELYPRPHLPSWITSTVSLAYTRGQPEPTPMLPENPWYKSNPERRKELLNQFRM